MMKTLRQEWDRLGIYLLLMAFGAYSTIYPIVSFERASPYWAELMLGAEFFAAGLLLMIGMREKKGYRFAGLIVVAVGLSTISLVIGIVGGARVLSYAFLFGAFAMQSIYDIRKERKAHREARRETEELTKELQELANGMRQGDE